MDKTYIADYDNLLSPTAGALKDEIESEVKALLQNSLETSNAGINAVKVTNLTNGSVVADMIIASSESTLLMSTLERTINDGIANGNLSSLSAIGTVTVQGI